MARKKQPTFIKGAFTHRRTESDYMHAMLESVTLDDWREVMTATLTAAKAGDAPARAFLAQYLVGRASHSAPAPLDVLTQRLTGRDALTDRIARPYIARMKFPTLHRDDFEEDALRDAVADELRALPSADHSSIATDDSALPLRRVK